MTPPRRSAAYRIAFFHSGAFALAILVLGVATYLAADREFRRQRDEALAAEASRVASLGPPAAVAREVTLRSRVRGHDAFLYALFDPAGRRVAGALDAAAPPLGPADAPFRDPREGDDEARVRTTALAGGWKLTVGLDAERIERIDAAILALSGAAVAGVLLIGAAGALALGAHLRRRLAPVEEVAAAVVAGDLTRRVPLGPRGDEFDGAAAAVNAMLDRLRSELALVGVEEGAAARAMEQGDALLSLFAAILRIAEVEGGAPARLPVDLFALVRDLGETYQPALADAGRPLSCAVEPGVAVVGDRGLLAQAVVNLLDNARAHTPPGTRVRLSLETAGTAARLSVADDGPGVPPADRGRILERFARTEASRTTPGAGLGLSLVRAVAAAHRGEAVVEDAAPGLRVVLILPRAA